MSKPAVANLICILAWTASLFLLPAGVVLCNWSHGPLVVTLGFVLMVAMVGGTSKWQFRLALYAVQLAVAAASGSGWALAGAALLAVMLMPITVGPGRPEAFAPSAAFCRLITETLNGRKYYARSELIGALHRVKPGSRTLFAVHPHGLLTAGYTWNMFWNLDFHEMTGRIGFLLDENLRLKSAGFRLMCDWYAGPKRWAGAATKRVMLEAMAKGETLALLPGGFQEATICERGVERVYIKKRAGFVKYCLQHGYAIVPCYTFGESDTYTTFTPLLRPRLALAARNIPAAAMFGNWRCPLLPHAGVELVTCVGDPLQLPCIAEPTKEDVAEWHAKYVAALQQTFDKYKAQANKADAVLEVW